MNINTLCLTDEETGLDLEFEIREHQEILLKAGIEIEPGVYVLIPEGPGYPHSMQVWCKAKDDKGWVYINSAGELIMSLNPLLGA
jgi:hypothetical protein